MERYNDDQEQGLLSLARANENLFGVAEKAGCFPFNFEDRIVYSLRAFENPGRSGTLHSAVSVLY